MGDTLRNPGFENKFTCPACLRDFNGIRTTICPGCGVSVECTLEHEPVCVCEVTEIEEREDDEEPDDSGYPFTRTNPFGER